MMDKRKERDNRRFKKKRSFTMNPTRDAKKGLVDQLSQVSNSDCRHLGAKSPKNSGISQYDSMEDER